MPRRPAQLVNCYVPLVLPSGAAAATSKGEETSHIMVDRLSSQLRRDGRQHGDLRQVVLETSVLGPALGPSLVEFGHTEVVRSPSGQRHQQRSHATRQQQQR